MDQLYANAQRYLREHNVLSLATSDGTAPWVAPVFYTVWSNKLVFLSALHTHHCKNIASNASVAASIHEDYRDWSQIKGLQLRGVAAQLPEQDVPSVISAYSDKFPIIGADAPAEIANALDRVSWFGVDVQQIYFIDNSRGLGHRDELDPGRLFAN